jgi:hypothetical protein
MGYVYVTSSCYSCGQIFSYHPNKVPSYRDPRTGSREPICRVCVERANPERKKLGLDPIVPLPGAYEACPEDEMIWDD